MVVVTHTAGQSEVPALLDSLDTNKTPVKMLYPQSKLLVLVF
jgi:hypothetical protein